MVDLSNRKFLEDLQDRLARVERGEVWGSDHEGPYTPQEKANEIARIKAEIARVTSGET